MCTLKIEKDASVGVNAKLNNGTNNVPYAPKLYTVRGIALGIIASQHLNAVHEVCCQIWKPGENQYVSPGTTTALKMETCCQINLVKATYESKNRTRLQRRLPTK